MPFLPPKTSLALVTINPCAEYHSCRLSASLNSSGQTSVMGLAANMQPQWRWGRCWHTGELKHALYWQMFGSNYRHKRCVDLTILCCSIQSLTSVESSNLRGFILLLPIHFSLKLHLILLIIIPPISRISILVTDYYQRNPVCSVIVS